ncbi:nucleotide sugar dehydrogenase [Alicyclobacillus dauci]|uniref:Nucleotide sugar dehydrogenase n=1 Tax=Alicyclobacillus dauci TaxID=1475485 RepID=A0ABY6Z6C5_9BACL|nr:nucleotide sugar dehydrogenase [Alicyclobacillus dauci]WAH37836.1 nucleotide sugar dehydrogenase [Alicyclobacillus dauci]
MRETVSVVGLGFIGLPLSICLCERGLRVIGVDTASSKVEQLMNGVAYVQEDYRGETLTERLQVHLASGAFVPTTRLSVAAWESTTYLVTVGIPTDPRTGSLVTEPLTEAMAALGRVIKPHDLVIIRSTVVPGMVEDMCVPILEEHSRMVAGVDFHVAYAAERVAEGRAMIEFQTLDIVVGGLTEQCAELAARVLGKLTDGHIHVTDLRVAQLAKVIENAQRDVNLAIVNQLRQVAASHHVDLYELIQMVNTHPRVNLLLPSVGVGGYCIPNAYHYLRASVDETTYPLPLFQTARELNEAVPSDIAGALAKELKQADKSIDGAVVAVLGLGMKDGSNDTRQSPAIRCVEELQRLGATVRAFDPLIETPKPYQVTSMEACLKGADAILVGAWQPAFERDDWAELLSTTSAPVLLVDPRHRIAAHVPDLLDAPVLQSV